MDGHRYADDAEPGWYPGQSQYARATDPEAAGSRGLSGNTSGNMYDSGVHDRPSGAFRLPEQRPHAMPDTANPTGSHARPAEPESRAAYDSVRVPMRGTSRSAPTTPADRVYQSRRSVSSYVVAGVMVVLLVPIVRLFVESTFTRDPTARSIVPAVLLTLGFTLSGIGLFAVAGGGPMTRDSWLRPPAAYLPAGLILLLAAGLAVA